MRIIAGPCQHESFEQSLEIAGHCNDICKKYELEYFSKLVTIRLIDFIIIANVVKV